MKKLLSICLVAVVSMMLSVVTATPKNQDKSPIVTTQFMADIDCESCAKKIMNSIPYKRGVKDVVVNLPKKVVSVSFDPKKCNNEELLKSFAKLKMKASIVKQ